MIRQYVYSKPDFATMRNDWIYEMIARTQAQTFFIEMQMKTAEIIRRNRLEIKCRFADMMRERFRMSKERAQEIVDKLTGTADDIEQHLEQGESIEDDTLLATIDSQMFLCETCGWWCELSEQCEDNNCEDCQE